MATAVAEKTASAQIPGSGPAQARGGFFQVYKPGEGLRTRLGMFMVALVFMLFSGHHWYYGWPAARNLALKILETLWLGVLLRWTEDLTWQRYISLFGAVGLGIAGLLAAYYYIYCHPRSSEFLVQTDGELRKVSWPKITPWFKPDTQVWGATYVVLIVVFVISLYVFGVDRILVFLSEKLFYGG